MVGLAGAIVQLAAQLVSDQWQQDVPAVCGPERARGTERDSEKWLGQRPLLDEDRSCDSPTWLAKQVALHHFAHAAELLAHQLQVRDALDELGQENAAKTWRVFLIKLSSASREGSQSELHIDGNESHYDLDLTLSLVCKFRFVCLLTRHQSVEIG